jgi:acetyl esterase/lipase
VSLHCFIIARENANISTSDPEFDRNFTINVFNTPAPEESEDCLYLNVYAPASSPPPEGRAVMFWIYGGSLQFGTAGQEVYNGTNFAAYQDVIIVTVNYRTNGKCSLTLWFCPALMKSSIWIPKLSRTTAGRQQSWIS